MGWSFSADSPQGTFKVTYFRIPRKKQGPDHKLGRQGWKVTRLFDAVFIDIVAPFAWGWGVYLFLRARGWVSRSVLNILSRCYITINDDRSIFNTASVWSPVIIVAITQRGEGEVLMLDLPRSILWKP
jgi:hypothetical protein